MIQPRVTADANILVSGVLRQRTDAAPVQFVDLWRIGLFTLVLSDHLLAEVDRALDSPYFAGRLDVADRDAFRQLLPRQAEIVPITIAVSGVAAHPEDDLVIATALSGDAQLLVTGDYALAGLRQYQSLIIVTVHEFLAMLPGLASGEGM